MRNDPRGTEHGSIPLVILAAIVLGGIIIALYLDVSTGLRLSAADRDFNQAIQVADAGLQQAFTTLATLDPADRPAIGEELVVPEQDGELGRGTYNWTARRVGSNRWEVRSTGEFGVHTRVLEAQMRPLQLFGLAAFADLLLELRGANAADSYSVGGSGSVGSNNRVVLRGNATVDWVTLYGDATYNQGGIIRTGGGIDDENDEMDLPDLGQRAYAEDGDGPCSGGVEYDDVSDIGGPLVRGVDYCVAQATFGAGEHPVVDNMDAALNHLPARIYIAPSGNLELRGQGNTRCSGVACVNWTVGETEPDATALQIYLAGGEGEVKANNHTVIAAGIYAPRSNCSGPNAQGDVYGSIVCRTLDSKGGWNFHFDERFNDVDLEYFAIHGVREEPGGTTSFNSGE